ncbi:type II secretion system GspH family protein [Patescibacteria group bacterium]|nr:type II secretion system GspH family protein [Patescibacteria group bacterium]MBU1970322.1 type II secretion system GspH family protein [Patescibacteria group bacterium]
MRKRQAGFTLIELLVVIGILAVLLAIVLIAINPARQFSQANNAKRSSDVNALLNAIHQYSADNKGNITTLGIPSSAAVVESTAFMTLCTSLVPTYIAALPVDPLTNNGAPVSDCAAAGGWDTNYTVSQSVTDSRITVSAPATELGIPVISVLR